jgi:hypothetical protein
MICIYQKLSESFIEKCDDYVNWFYVSSCQELSRDFLIENLNKIYAAGLVENEHLEKSLIEEVVLLLKMKI